MKQQTDHTAQGEPLQRAVPTLTDPVSGAKLWTIKSFLEQIPDKLEFIVDGLLPTSALSLLSAKIKVGKSTFARGLAAAISGVRDKWMGREIINGKAIYVSLEEGQRTVGRHFAQIIDTPDPDNPRLWVFDDPPHQLGPDPLAQLDSWIDKILPDLIIIDPLFRFIKLQEEYSQVTERMQDLIDLAHQGQAHIMLVHHANKSSGGDRGDEILGSTAIGAAADVILSLSMDSNKQRSLYGYGRDIEDFPETILSMDSNRWISLAGTVAAAKSRVYSEALREDIINYLDGCRGVWQCIGAIQKSIKRRRQDVGIQLRWLANKGDIEERGTGLKNAPYEYQIEQRG